MFIAESSAAIVIDNGSGIIKGGLAGDEAPRSTFQNLVGKPKN
jgi:actin